jgi:murein DD-endopeptidase MepM/ murein hydrolase activator NlpD
MSRRRRTAALLVLNLAQLLLVLSVFAVRTETAQAAQASWGWPLPGDSVVEHPFQPPASAWGAGHRGVDLRGTLDEPVLAAGAGWVSYSGLLAGRGVVTVTHGNGLRTTYEPVHATVAIGAHVRLGDVLGTLATGHASCRPGTVCLHWGLLRGSTYLDPLALVTQGRLRLLPLGGLTPSRATTAAVQATIVGRLVPALPPSPEAVTHPRRRAVVLFVNNAVNVAAVGALGWGAYAGSRRLLRRVRRA